MASLVKTMSSCRRLIAPLCANRSAYQRLFMPQRNMSQAKDSEEFEAPIKYSTSKAADWKAYDTFAPPPSTAPWYQSYIVIASVATFLIYFCILREENDLDQDITTSIYDRVPGLEVAHIQGAIKYERQQGRDTVELEQRLADLTVKGQ